MQVAQRLGQRLSINPIALISLFVLIFEHIATITLTRYTQQRSDAPKPSPSVSVLATELLKLYLAVGLELLSCGGVGNAAKLDSFLKDVLNWKDTLRMSVPAILYTIQNNMIYIALNSLEVVTFQVLYQTKLIVTGLLSVAFLHRSLTKRQWVAILGLTVGVILVELSSDDSVKTVSIEVTTTTTGPLAKSVWGTLAGGVVAIICAFLSSSASVYTEAVVKRAEAECSTPPSLWVRNVQLCIFTIPVACMGVALQNDLLFSSAGDTEDATDPTGDLFERLMRGFDAPAQILVLLNASGGLIVAVVLKYGDNLLRNFSTGFSVIGGCLVSVVLFDFQLSVQFILGASIVIGSTYYYATASSASPPPPKPQKGGEQGKTFVDVLEEDEEGPGEQTSLESGQAKDNEEEEEEEGMM